MPRAQSHFLVNQTINAFEFAHRKSCDGKRNKNVICSSKTVACERPLRTWTKNDRRRAWSKNGQWRSRPSYKQISWAAITKAKNWKSNDLLAYFMTFIFVPFFRLNSAQNVEILQNSKRNFHFSFVSIQLSSAFRWCWLSRLAGWWISSSTGDCMATSMAECGSHLAKRRKNRSMVLNECMAKRYGWTERVEQLLVQQGKAMWQPTEHRSMEHQRWRSNVFWCSGIVSIQFDYNICKWQIILEIWNLTSFSSVSTFGSASTERRLRAAICWNWNFQSNIFR